MSVPSPPVWTPPQQTQAPEERIGLTRIMWFGIIAVAGMVTSWVLGFYIFGSLFSSTALANLGPNPTPAEVSQAMGSLFQSIQYVIPVTLVIGLAGMAALTSGFMALKKVDQSKFSYPSNFMILMIIGSLIAAVGVIPFVNGLPNILAQVPPNPNSTPSSAFVSAIGSVVVFALVAGLGGLLALIGLIGGMMLGLWRVGSRYNETLFKLGAIFVIIPLLDVVAPILVVVAALQVRGRLPGGA